MQLIRNIFSNKSKHAIKAVEDQDLEKYLNSLGVLEEIKKGEVLCQYCGNKITIESLEAIVPRDGSVKFVCRNKNCMNQI